MPGYIRLVLLTLTSTPTSQTPDATALSYLLHKHPDRVQSFDLAIGTATILYPESSAEKTTVAVIVDVDPIELVQSRYRRGKSGDNFSLGSTSTIGRMRRRPSSRLPCRSCFAPR
ncbi:hypothetical protein GCM10020255_079450 [Rhodococcus baikonurensis]